MGSSLGFLFLALPPKVLELSDESRRAAVAAWFDRRMNARRENLCAPRQPIQPPLVVRTRGTMLAPATVDQLELSVAMPSVTGRHSHEDTRLAIEGMAWAEFTRGVYPAVRLSPSDQSASF